MNTTYLESQTPENYISNFAVFAQIYFIMSYINTIWEDFVRNLPQSKIWLDSPYSIKLISLEFFFFMGLGVRNTPSTNSTHTSLTAHTQNDDSSQTHH